MNIEIVIRARTGGKKAGKRGKGEKERSPSSSSGAPN